MLRYAITHRQLLAATEPTCRAALLDQARFFAAQSRAEDSPAQPFDFFQLREKDLPAAALADLARELLTILRPTRAKLLINSRADIALAVAAPGVHLTASPGSLTPAQIRSLYARAHLPEPIISLSCHTLADVTHAASGNPDSRPTHILFGPVFEKRVNSALISDGTGLDLLRAACLAAAPIPVLALGGINVANTPACLAAGAAGIAAIRLFLPPNLPHAQTMPPV